MIEMLLSYATELLQIAALTAILVLCLPGVRRTGERLCVILFLLAMAAFLLSDLYWLAHTILREGMRVPFSANDIADFGLFLLLSSAMEAALGWRRPPLGLTLAAIAFAAANVSLWIGWSGEWVRDLFGGLSFGYFIYVCTGALYQTGALGRREWIGFAVLCPVLIAVEWAGILLPARRVPMETVGYVLLFAAAALLLVRAGLSLVREKTVDTALSLSFSCFCWCSIALYMSSDVIYTVISNIWTFCTILMYLAVRKKVQAS